MSAKIQFDPFPATTSDLQTQLAAGHVTSAQLVQDYLAEIARNNEYLRAVIVTSPDALVEARALDGERAAGILRGPLHGIPVLIKDNVANHPSLRMDTTAGSYALAGSRPVRHADVVQRAHSSRCNHLGQGKFIREFSHAADEVGLHALMPTIGVLLLERSTGIRCAWSAVGGQGQSAYVRGGIRPDDSVGGHSNPCGSSSGSAVAVSAGFAPVSIGTETMGSLTYPADRAALYTIKPTIGLISQEGIVPISPLFDSAGPMAKCSRDVGLLLDVLVDLTRTKVPSGGYVSATTGSWDGIKIGVLDPEAWYHGSDFVKYEADAVEQMTRDIRAVYQQLEKFVKVLRHVSLISVSGTTSNGDNDILKFIATSNGQSDFLRLIDHDFKRVFENYLATVENSKIQTLTDLIRFNEEHADLELPEGYDNQDALHRAVNSNLTDDEYQQILTEVRKAGRERGIDKTLQDNDVDVIIGPADGLLCYISAAAGYPIATLPLSYLDFNGRPFGLVAMASAHQDALLVQVQSAGDAPFPRRKPPPMFWDGPKK